MIRFMSDVGQPHVARKPRCGNPGGIAVRTACVLESDETLEYTV